MRILVQLHFFYFVQKWEERLLLNSGCDFPGHTTTHNNNEKEQHRSS